MCRSALQVLFLIEPAWVLPMRESEYECVCGGAVFAQTFGPWVMRPKLTHLASSKVVTRKEHLTVLEESCIEVAVNNRRG
jgi:hypothetical protein